jgi:hypothetical protein
MLIVFHLSSQVYTKLDALTLANGAGFPVVSLQSREHMRKFHRNNIAFITASFTKG